jgi:hypothetical protein
MLNFELGNQVGTLTLVQQDGQSRVASVCRHACSLVPSPCGVFCENDFEFIETCVYEDPPPMHKRGVSGSWSNKTVRSERDSNDVVHAIDPAGQHFCPHA